MGGNLAAEWEDWSFAGHRGNGIQIPLTLRRTFATPGWFEGTQITTVWRKTGAQSLESGFRWLWGGEGPVLQFGGEIAMQMAISHLFLVSKYPEY